MNFIDKSRKHLILSKVTYKDHFFWALKSGLILISIGVASIIHGIAPFLFEGTTAKKIIEIFYQHLYNHPNPEYQIIIKKEFKKAIQ